jgi:hypothetical protein
MIQPKETKSYNERLFSGGIRTFFHAARFRWLQKSMQQLNLQQGTVLELGCFDGKALDYLPFSPSMYTGYDANWEGGLDLGKQRWAHQPNYRFHFCDKLIDFNPTANRYDYTIAMETLEHLKLKELEAYLQQLAAATNQYCFVSVPNEMGVIFSLKHLGKKLFLAVDEPYTPTELWYTLLGRLDKVKRLEEGHKGFDYRELIKLLEHYFEVQSIKGLPFTWLPIVFNFSVGIVLKKKNN